MILILKQKCNRLYTKSRTMIWMTRKNEIRSIQKSLYPDHVIQPCVSFSRINSKNLWAIFPFLQIKPNITSIYFDESFYIIWMWKREEKANPSLSSSNIKPNNKQYYSDRHGTKIDHEYMHQIPYPRRIYYICPSLYLLYKSMKK